MSLFSNPFRRKRFNAVTVASAGVGGFIQTFGAGSPQAGLAMEQAGQYAPNSTPLYRFFPGDIFTPGAEGWVFEPSHDGPLNTMWGHAFLRRPNTFLPLQPPQVYTAAASALYGLNGQIAGQIITQPLSEPAAQ